MSKRKRAELEDDTGGAASSLSDNSLTKFRGLLQQSQQQLASAVRLARGFERQKLGRRQKDASNDPQTLPRLRAEVVVLKELDFERVAKNYQLKYLLRSKRVRETPEFGTIYGNDPKTEHIEAGAQANVLGRLFNSNPVKNAMQKFMDDVYHALGLNGDVKAPPKPQEEAGRIKQRNELGGDAGNGASENDTTAINAQDHSSVSDHTTNTGQDRLIASSSDEISLSEHSDAPSTSLLPPPAPPSPRETKTAFLPSLSMAGYYSGSESDGGDHSSLPDLKHRKNRRGQRARQQIAEMKYGRTARHLHARDQTAEPGREAGWDARRGAVDGSDHRKGRFGHGSKGSHGAAGGAVRTETKPKKMHRDDAGPLHPSWQAAKQKKGQARAQPEFTGKKVVFE